MPLERDAVFDTFDEDFSGMISLIKMIYLIQTEMYKRK